MRRDHDCGGDGAGSMVLLGVNIDHVATVRQARGTNEPDPVWAAAEAELGGADGITFHLREDRRHISDRDARLLSKTVAVPLNMEMAATDEMIGIARELAPAKCTLVPEKREELTTEGGLDVAGHLDRMSGATSALKQAGIAVCAFVEPDPRQIEAAAKAGFDSVELWTGGYAHASSSAEADSELARLQSAIESGLAAGLVVHGGHGLTYRNVGPVAALAGFTEFNIGHSIVSRSVFVGIREAVRSMKELLVRHAPR